MAFLSPPTAARVKPASELPTPWHLTESEKPWMLDMECNVFWSEPRLFLCWVHVAAHPIGLHPRLDFGVVFVLRQMNDLLVLIVIDTAEKRDRGDAFLQHKF